MNNLESKKRKKTAVLILLPIFNTVVSTILGLIVFSCFTNDSYEAYEVYFQFAGVLLVINSIFAYSLLKKLNAKGKFFYNIFLMSMFLEAVAFAFLGRGFGIYIFIPLTPFFNIFRIIPAIILPFLALKESSVKE